ncbi:Uncharacterized protein PECH_004357 [Penicillium ucsense]|uniref:RING-type E3 ubiquitin transferase n=1 Tax=Penicillium ucsense TaxID=2839758 RepID=A0A8J8W2Y2_9EURO|nr:Uncharacterized protein PECM_005311 [Penicillium ucsense]KAF7737049.1 Uncharacterized protein PECH_004357 [Penicillium ucsense]
MRLAVYVGTSVALATGVFFKALHQRANFYSACVYLSQSSANLMILTNLCLLATGFILFWLQRLFFGTLRPIEIEQLYERGWFAVTETCLAMTIFRGELGLWFLVMMVPNLVLKMGAFLTANRLEVLEQQPLAHSVMVHYQMSFALNTVAFFSAFMMYYCIRSVIDEARANMMITFSFEFAILTIVSISTFLRYVLLLAEIVITRRQIRAQVELRRAEIRATRAEMIREHARAGASSPPTDLPDENDVNELEIDVPGWEEKGRWIFYLDLVTDFLKLVVYAGFFAILIRFFGLPIHILRDLVLTARSFVRRIGDFIRYRKATRDMSSRYPDATPEETAREDVCIICREEMISILPAAPTEGAPAPPPPANVPDRLRPKKLPCGHVLHFACLRSWLERQQRCPTCRRPVLGDEAQGAPAGANNQGGNAAAAAAQPNGPGGNPAPVQRARVFRFGPFRVGFGAVRGDVLQNIHQQIHQGAAAPAQPPADANHPGAQHIGFGFGFGRPHAPLAPVAPVAPAPAQTPASTPAAASASVHAQLQSIEQQIEQELASLRAAAEHVQRVAHLQAELEQLRLEVNSSTEDATATSTSSSGQTQFTSARSEALGAGDPRLPEGLVLPAGWTLQPFNSAASVRAESNPATAPPAWESGSSGEASEINAGLGSTATGSSPKGKGRATTVEEVEDGDAL